MSMVNLGYAAEQQSKPKTSNFFFGSLFSGNSMFNSTKTLLAALEEEQQVEKDTSVPRWRTVTAPSAHKPTRSPFYAQQLYAYNFILRPMGVAAFAYHTTVALIILLELLFFALSTVTTSGSALKSRSLNALRALLIAALFVQTSEFLILIWASSCLGRYRGFLGKSKFVVSPFRILNLLFIGITAVMLWTTCFPSQEETQKYEWLRLGIIFQVFRLENRFKPWRFFRSVLWVERQHLFASAFVIFIIFSSAAYVLYFIEHQEPETGFTNLPNAFWWSVVTGMGLGYGDISPATTAGKCVMAFSALFACVAFQIPSGILSTGLALRTYERNRRKNKAKRVVPAARLIQIAWRVRVALRKIRYLRNENASKMVHQMAVVFIAKLQFDLARRRFRDATRLFDLKDVLQQYSEGHAALVEQVKAGQVALNTMHYGLDGALSLVEGVANQQWARLNVIERAVEEAVAAALARRKKRFQKQKKLF